MSTVIAMLAIWAAYHVTGYLPVWEPISRKCCGWIEQDRPWAALGLVTGVVVIEGVCAITIALLLITLVNAAVMFAPLVLR